MTPLQVCRQWAGLLTAAGVRAGVNPRDVQTPCVLFVPPVAVQFDLGCGGTAELRGLLLVSGPAQDDAWAALEELLPLVLDVLPVAPDSLRTTTYSTDPTFGQMPAYELSFTLAVDWSQP